ncbi:DUF4112 domain-containing protein [Pelomonas sp. Root1444]|uniref:DUF4112 domain-containing protein n=1 Tax=Pelomonas sp. Root1444 TaxID=1736464 RepID=UPI000703761F|nr:DUF4112 domain-containing protein [Pelomonas sp. Root1444]KQY83433.1 hypothetical protein ASD35_24635 [Pelomonas sp. Root1444]
MPTPNPRPAQRQSAVRARLKRLAWLLDSAIPLPGGYRIGLDGLIGLVPGLGDVVSAVLSSYIVLEAARLRVPGSVLLRMGLNVALELIIGAVPVAGDLFDFAFKANERNVRLLEASLGPPEQVLALRRRSGWTVAAALAVPALVLLLALALVIGLVTLVVAGPFG